MCGKELLLVGLFTGAGQSCSCSLAVLFSLEQLVSCAPAALTKLRVLPHVGGFFEICGAESGREADPVPKECGNQRKGCDFVSLGWKIWSGGDNSSTTEKSVRFLTF